MSYDLHPYDRLVKDALDDCEYPERIESVATFVGAELLAGRPAEVVLEPGNGTRYPYLFVPVSALSTFSTGRENLESASVGDPESAVWVAYLGHGGGVYPVALLGRTVPPTPDYIGEKWFGGKMSFDAAILQELFRHIGEKTVRPVVVPA